MVQADHCLPRTDTARRWGRAKRFAPDPARFAQGYLISDYDIVILGETMLRLTPPGLQRLEQARHFAIEVGGTESNVAIGLARLGLRVLWLSRLTANALGRVIAHSIASHGVDTSRVVWTEDDRVGLLFLEEGKMPRGSRVYYDRRHSAVSRMRPEDLPAEVFRLLVPRSCT